MLTPVTPFLCILSSGPARVTSGSGGSCWTPSSGPAPRTDHPTQQLPGNKEKKNVSAASHGFVEYGLTIWLQNHYSAHVTNAHDHRSSEQQGICQLPFAGQHPPEANKISVCLDESALYELSA